MSSRLDRIAHHFLPHRAESLLFRYGARALSIAESLVGRAPWDPRRGTARFQGDRLDIDGYQVMQSWEEPIMHVLAESVAAAHGDVLELGFGLGISARHIQRLGVKSYTVVEANPDVVQTIHEWSRRESIPVTVLEGLWADREHELESYDGILFDTFPTSWAEHTDAYLMDTMLRLRAHLRPAGVLAYFWRYHRAVPEAHQAALCEVFREVVLRRVSGLSPPESCDYWRHDSMIAVTCRL